MRRAAKWALLAHMLAGEQCCSSSRSTFITRVHARPRWERGEREREREREGRKVTSSGRGSFVTLHFSIFASRERVRCVCVREFFKGAVCPLFMCYGNMSIFCAIYSGGIYMMYRGRLLGLTIV